MQGQGSMTTSPRPSRRSLLAAWFSSIFLGVAPRPARSNPVVGWGASTLARMLLRVVARRVVTAARSRTLRNSARTTLRAMDLTERLSAFDSLASIAVDDEARDVLISNMNRLLSSFGPNHETMHCAEVWGAEGVRGKGENWTTDHCHSHVSACEPCYWLFDQLMHETTMDCADYVGRPRFPLDVFAHTIPLRAELLTFFIDGYGFNGRDVLRTRAEKREGIIDGKRHYGSLRLTEGVHRLLIPHGSTEIFFPIAAGRSSSISFSGFPSTVHARLNGRKFYFGPRSSRNGSLRPRPGTRW